MIWLLLLTLATLLVLVTAVFLLGFRIGSSAWRAELDQVRTDSILAAREMHDLTRQAFVAMATAAERRKPS
jgi:hypothetical protein